MHTLKVKKEFEWNKIGSYKHGNPYSIIWAYPRNGEPYIIKGGANDCQNYIRALQEPIMYYTSYWKNGRQRGRWGVVGIKTHIYFHRRSKKKINNSPTNHSWDIRKEGMFDNSSNHILYLRRVPRKWLKELDQFCD